MCITNELCSPFRKNNSNTGKQFSKNKSKAPKYEPTINIRNCVFIGYLKEMEYLNMNVHRQTLLIKLNMPD